MKIPLSKDYEIVREARPTFIVKSKDEVDFSENHNWRFVIDLSNLKKYSERIRAVDLFSSDIVKKLHTQRPLELSSAQKKHAPRKKN